MEAAVEGPRDELVEESKPKEREETMTRTSDGGGTRLTPMGRSPRLRERELLPNMDVWARADSMPLRGIQPKSKAPCPPLVEQAAKQRKMAVGAGEDHEGASEDE